MDRHRDRQDTVPALRAGLPPALEPALVLRDEEAEPPDGGLVLVEIEAADEAGIEVTGLHEHDVAARRLTEGAALPVFVHTVVVFVRRRREAHARREGTGE